ncbi:hypothetical protein [Bordetella hinzii]|uniref:hypothetical protein n=1 Tax=Bordetella hinzii TaxID=103855 RepID=UPI000518D8EA|nr:hypothetical protein [Bordetella hinzii]
MFDSSRKYWFDRNDDYHTQRRKKQRSLRNQKTGLDFEDDMFALHKSHQVLFITLNIKPCFRDDVNFRTMQKFRDDLFRRIKDARAYARERKRMGKPIQDHRRTILHDTRGALWRQEYGEDGGSHHVHVVAFVSVRRRDHVAACDDLGMEWERITRGWGTFHNGNRYRHSYRDKWGVAIGYVHRNDDEKRFALQKLIGLYMAKASQTPGEREEGDELFGVRYFG